MITDIANIALLAAAITGLIAMLRWDLRALQLSGFQNSRYNAWLRQSSDLTSPKRLAVLAVLIACFTTMAQASWMVVMLLAAVLALLALGMLVKKHDNPLRVTGHVVRRFAVAMILVLLVIGGTIILGKRMHEADILRSASMIAVMILAISPLLTMLTNWLLHLFEKPINNTQNTDEGND